MFEFPSPPLLSPCWLNDWTAWLVVLLAVKLGRILWCVCGDYCVEARRVPPSVRPSWCPSTCSSPTPLEVDAAIPWLAPFASPPLLLCLEEVAFVGPVMSSSSWGSCGAGLWRVVSSVCVGQFYKHEKKHIPIHVPPHTHRHATAATIDVAPHTPQRPRGSASQAAAAAAAAGTALGAAWGCMHAA